MPSPLPPSRRGARAPTRAAITLTLATLLLPATAAAADAYDPEIHWRTIETPRFFVHHPDGARNLAVRVARIAEEELDRVSELVGYAPEAPIELVITDADDDANGWARVTPRPVINVRLAAPTELTGLSSYDDWLRLLLIHEMTHVCVIDMTFGVTAIYDSVFGSYARMNRWVPHFLSEGVAVWAETVLTTTGRGRSTYVDMILRTGALDGTFLSIDRANLQWSDWPGGNASYYYGGNFHLWLAERFGGDKVAELHRTFAAAPLPFIYWFGAEEVFGDSLPDLWEQWRESEVERAEAIAEQTRAAGLTESERITFHGRNVTGTRFAPDGSYIVYSRTSPYDGSTVRRVDPDGENDQTLVLETYSPRFAFSPDGASLFYSQEAINDLYYEFNDLYRYDVPSGDATRLKNAADPETSLRARDPDVSPDGRRIVFVQNRLHQSWVTLGTFGEEEPDALDLRVLVPPFGDRQCASPRFSPDGELIAVSMWFEDGKRDIVVVDAESGALLRRVTFDRALDGNPAWSPDGRFLLYESDASGISNIYAFAWASGQYYRVTNVIGGAFQADVSPDGEKLLFRNASGYGFDIHLTDFDPSAWQPLAYDPTEGYAAVEAAPPTPADAGPTPSWGVARPRDQEPPLDLDPEQVEVSYTPRGLGPFDLNWNLSPSFYLTDDDPGFLLLTYVSDALDRHTFGLYAGTTLYSEALNWGALYVNDVWYPTITLGYDDATEAYRSEAYGILRQRTQTASAAVSWPIRQRHLARVSYVFSHDTLDPVLAEVWEIGEQQSSARLEFGYTYRYTREYAYSVGDEDGGSVALAGRWYSTGLGGAFDELMLTLDARAYLNAVWAKNHVLALRLVTAFSFGPDYNERFNLGGWTGVSFFTSSASQTYPLRGFPLDAALSGAGLAAVYAEYRFPIWHIERGLWTVPIYVQRLHGAVFAEGGNTFGNGDERDAADTLEKAWRRIKGGRLGAGAELRLDISIGWRVPLTIRGGVAFPVFNRGRVDFSDVIPYTSFGAAI